MIFERGHSPIAAKLVLHEDIRQIQNRSVQKRDCDFMNFFNISMSFSWSKKIWPPHIILNHLSSTFRRSLGNCHRGRGEKNGVRFLFNKITHARCSSICRPDLRHHRRQIQAYTVSELIGESMSKHRGERERAVMVCCAWLCHGSMQETNRETKCSEKRLPLRFTVRAGGNGKLASAR